MKKGFYIKLAWSGIKKNKKLYLPFMLTCIGMVMMLYIISFLADNPTLAAIRGGDTMQTMLSLGRGVVAVFILIFLFYTNSFLIRRRKKEFGLFNILGMGKRNLVQVMSFECLIIYAISVMIGLITGILFSKAAELLMINILTADVDFSFSVGINSIVLVLVWFAVVFLLLLANNLRQIHMANPIELLHSENFGEKPPKARRVLALFGLLILAAAYYIALSIKEPISAMLWFFVAVIMVIIATYILFIAGSVVFCRMLQKNRNYYYKTNHFVSVSSMVYRMKRNGAGLASICILATIVLVMISSTACLYIGKEESLRARYPRNIIVITASNDPDIHAKVRKTVNQALTGSMARPYNILEYTQFSIDGFLDNKDYISFDGNDLGINHYSGVHQLLFFTLEEYSQLSGNTQTLLPGEVLVYTPSSWHPNFVTFNTENTVRVKAIVPRFIEDGDSAALIVTPIYFVMENEAAITTILGNFAGASYTNHYYEFDLDCSEEEQIQIYNKISQSIRELRQSDDFPSISCEGVAKERADFYGIYGGLFFLGIMLGIVFLFATVLIMYYKQISEGYEDQSRFEIMQKIGMTKLEIRQSINSQVLTVFFLPLIFAGIHLAFAFPLISRLLLLFSLANTKFLIAVTVACYVIFALFYVIVYRITSHSYYQLVSNGRDNI